MTSHRPILAVDKIHPSALKKISHNHQAILGEAQNAIEANEWVVLGMAQNPFVKKARKLLKERGIAYHYIAYGSYLKDWRKRNVFKMWTGWPTFPMVFHRGVLLGGAARLERYLASL